MPTGTTPTTPCDGLPLQTGGGEVGRFSTVAGRQLSGSLWVLGSSEGVSHQSCVRHSPVVSKTYVLHFSIIFSPQQIVRASQHVFN